MWKIYRKDKQIQRADMTSILQEYLTWQIRCSFKHTTHLTDQFDVYSVAVETITHLKQIQWHAADVLLITFMAIKRLNKVCLFMQANKFAVDIYMKKSNKCYNPFHLVSDFAKQTEKMPRPYSGNLTITTRMVNVFGLRFFYAISTWNDVWLQKQNVFIIIIVNLFSIQRSYCT